MLLRTVSAINKYRFLNSAIVAVFLYIAGIDGIDRWDATMRRYEGIKEKQAAILRPGEMAEKKLALLGEEKFLAASFHAGNDSYEQNQTGIFTFLTAKAMEAGIRIVSLIPSELPLQNQVKTIQFKLLCAGSYHEIAGFINRVETGSLTIAITRTSITGTPNQSGALMAEMEGEAAFLVTQGMEK